MATEREIGADIFKKNLTTGVYEIYQTVDISSSSSTKFCAFTDDHQKFVIEDINHIRVFEFNSGT